MTTTTCLEASWPPAVPGGVVRLQRRARLGVEIESGGGFVVYGIRIDGTEIREPGVLKESLPKRLEDVAKRIGHPELASEIVGALANSGTETLFEPAAVDPNAETAVAVDACGDTAVAGSN